MNSVNRKKCVEVEKNAPNPLGLLNVPEYFASSDFLGQTNCQECDNTKTRRPLTSRIFSVQIVLAVLATT